MKSPAPTPFAQNAQYKKSFKSDPPAADPDAAELEKPNGKTKPKKKLKASSKKKRCPGGNVKDAPKVCAVPASGSGDVGEYKAQEYSKLRQAFISEAREKGASFTEAANGWNTSQQKRKLLSTLSVPELRRRRFIGKEIDHNPWCEEEWFHNHNFRLYYKKVYIWYMCAMVNCGTGQFDFKIHHILCVVVVPIG